ncbi:GumC family protein [Hyphomicrobium methylovorum]|uniref:GumC family protein n=1 Tax=Hyphomicrobium methylovorum TaxID=84 RepID=UPI0015E63156|nr:exopolysaccharide transport family protein [Hyphomicrobium methylovorum]
MEFDRRLAEANLPIDVQGEQFHRSGGISLTMLTEMVRRNMRLLAGIAAVGVGLMTLFLMVSPKSYTASGSILLDSRQPKLFNLDGLLASGDANQDNIETQIALLRSTRVAERVIDLMEERGISLPAVETKASVTDTSQLNHSAHLNGKMRDPSLIDGLLRRLKIERKGRSLLVDVMYSDTNPVRAAGIANAYMDGYIADQLDSRSVATRSNSKVLKERVEELRDELVKSEQEIQKYKAENDIIELGTVTLAQQEVANHEQELAKVRAMAAQADARVGQVGSMANELARDAAKSQVKILEAGLEDLKKKVQKSSEQLLKLDELRRDADALKKTYVALLTRYRETQAQESAISPDAQIVNYAVTPSTPSFPKKPLMLVLAAFLSLLLGSAAILVRELMRAKIYSAADVERIYGIAPLTLVPEKRSFGLDLGRAAFSGFSGGKIEQAVFTLRRWAEGVSRSKNIVIAVVSNKPGDGCSTIASALAFAAARTGRKTLLVDADFRSHGLTRAFANLQDGEYPYSGTAPGIISLGEKSPDFRGATLDQGQSALDVLDAPVLSKLLDKARQNYELTVIDTAPAGDYIDAGAVIDVADGVVVVVRSGVTNRKAAENIIRQLFNSESKPVGIVLNRVARPSVERLRDIIPDSWWNAVGGKIDALKSRVRPAA